MNILLDTHIFLWALLTPEKLSKKTIKLLNGPESVKYLSAVSSWEIAIKYAKGSLILPRPPREFVVEFLISAGILSLPINVNDTLLVSDLPHYHKDPFDRLLITQARANNLRILTDDRVFERYDVDIMGL